MIFAAPLALLGLLAIPLLILLDRMRRRPRPMPWPSLLLWRVAAAGEAPRRRAFDPLLLLECAAAALLALAAAEPALVTGRLARTVVVLRDTGPHMRARCGKESVAEASDREWARLRAALDARDEIREFETPRDLARAAAGLPDADLRVVVTDRPGIGGPGLLVLGRAATGSNVGIDAVQVEGDRLWFALGTDGEPREVEVRNSARTMRVPTGEGIETESADTLALVDGGNCAEDDACRLERIELFVRDGVDTPLTRAALFRAGVAARSREPFDLILTAEGGEAIDGVVRGAETALSDGLFSGLYLQDCAWTGAKSKPGAGLLHFRGRAVAAWVDARTLWVGLPFDREWDDHGTLALFLEAAKRECVRRKAGARGLAGAAFADPAPGFLDTRGVDRPFRGPLPEARRRIAGATAFRGILAAAAAVVLALYLRAIVRGP
ncbi:MAG: BatA domain-containing protein [Planctomycetaceae bacterium]